MSHKRPKETFHSPAEWEAYLDGFEDALQVEEREEYTQFLERIAFDVHVLRQNPRFIEAYNDTIRFFRMGWNQWTKTTSTPIQ